MENFADGLVQIREFRVEGEALVDKTLGELTFPKPCVVAAIIHEGGIITPDNEQVITEGDSVYLIAPSEFMDELGRLFSQPPRSLPTCALSLSFRIAMAAPPYPMPRLARYS